MQTACILLREARCLFLQIRKVFLGKYYPVKIAPDKITENDAYIHGQYLKSMKLPESQRNAEVIKSICNTVREAAYDEERNTEKKGQILFLTGEMDSCSHYEAASYTQKAAIQCTGLQTGFENILSRILDCKR